MALSKSPRINHGNPSNPSSKSSLAIDDITLYPNTGLFESDRLSFEPGIRNEIVIQFKGTVEEHGHVLHDIELLDEAGRDWNKRLIEPDIVS
jgi:hypothetical protein